VALDGVLFRASCSVFKVCIESQALNDGVCARERGRERRSERKMFCVSASVCKCVCVFSLRSPFRLLIHRPSMVVCVCVCVRERKGVRERGSVWVRECVIVCVWLFKTFFSVYKVCCDSLCVCVRLREIALFKATCHL